MEIYDNSHWQGECGVGGMVVMGKEGFIRRSFRFFPMQNTSGDDHATMRFMVEKRFTSGSDLDPDLMIIDGGKGHLHTVTEVLQKIKKTIFL